MNIFAKFLLVASVALSSGCDLNALSNNDEQIRTRLSYDFGTARGCLKFAQTLTSGAAQSGSVSILEQSFEMEDQSKVLMLEVAKRMDMPAMEFISALSNPDEGMLTSDETSCRAFLDKKIDGQVSTTQNVEALQSAFDENRNNYDEDRKDLMKAARNVKTSFDNLEKTLKNSGNF